MTADVCTDGSDQTHVVKSAVRTLQILELFDEIRQPLNVVSVSEALGYPQSSTAALLRSLVAMGYLHYEERARTYVPTDRVSLLGNWISPALFESGNLIRLIRAISKRTGQLALVATRNGDFAQYIHVLNAPNAVSHHIRIGQKRPLATSGVGLMLLSSLPDSDVKRMYHRMNAYTHDAEQKANVPELLAQLCDVRKQGYAFSANRVVEGYGMIAVRIPEQCASRPLVIGVGGSCQTLESQLHDFVDIIREEIATNLNQSYEAPREKTAKPRVTIRIPAFASMGAAADRHVA
jgi:DNA-binding IclR family transcriptional regulator